MHLSTRLQDLVDSVNKTGEYAARAAQLTHLSTIAKNPKMTAMDTTTDALPDDRIRAEIGKLMAETVKLEQRKLNAEANKMTREHAWYPAVALAAAAGAGAALAGVLLKLYGV